MLFLQPVAGATGPVVCEQTIVIPPPPTEAPPTNTPTNTPTDGPSPTTVTPAETTQPPQAQGVCVCVCVCVCVNMRMYLQACGCIRFRTCVLNEYSTVECTHTNHVSTYHSKLSL